MTSDAMRDLMDKVRDDTELRAALTAAKTPEDVVRAAAERGVIITVADLTAGEDLTDAELESLAGGYTFPPTDWIYCDNPWTNAYCTAKC